MTIALTALAAFDSRPFFDKALHHGVRQGILSSGRVQAIQTDFAKGIVQIANYFGTAYLRPDLELALRRMVYLMSLYLEEVSGGDLAMAAASLRDNTLLTWMHLRLLLGFVLRLPLLLTRRLRRN